MKIKNKAVLVTSLVIILCVLVSPAHARKKKNNSKEPVAASEVESRINNLNPDDKRKFEALSAEQQKLIRSGKIDQGFNAWMVELALGKPFYGTEHHPIFTDYAEVWLYTRPEITQDKTENKIIDSQTNWPTIHRITKIKVCTVGDFFVLWDRGVVQKITPADAKTQGKCTLETKEAFLPIVDGKPVEP